MDANDRVVKKLTAESQGIEWQGAVIRIPRVERSSGED